MIQHVALEVSPALLPAEGEFWQAVGFARVPVPEALGSGFDWYEREGTQIHLMEVADPSAPPVRGHVAVVPADFNTAIERVEGAGFEVTESRQLWGARRAKARTPAGHVVELMEFPP
ncbi:MAG: hypothetical protein KDB54_07625 [Solirubrobacterales bacterium]|nr:hypothetical protein [Solirubrobacterales bacterium]